MKWVDALDVQCLQPIQVLAVRVYVCFACFCVCFSSTVISITFYAVHTSVSICAHSVKAKTNEALEEQRSNCH